MSCLEAFKNKPVMIQLKNMILTAISEREVTLGDGVKCGVAGAGYSKTPGKPDQLIGAPFILGEIEDFDKHYLLVASLGADNKTPVRYCLERDNVINITFCVEHIPAVTSPLVFPPGTRQ